MNYIRKFRRYLFIISLFIYIPLSAASADTTPPIFSGIIRDGNLTFNDQEITFSTSTLYANWDAAADNESNIKSYYFCIGTRSGKSDILDWTDNGLSLIATTDKLSLKTNKEYYFSVYAENKDNLKSEILISNGCEVKKKPKVRLRKLTEEDKAMLASKQRPVKRGLAATALSLPLSVKNYQYLPPIENQGSQGSCVGWAVGYYYKTYQEAREHGWINPTESQKIMSPSFLYNLGNMGEDQGSYISENMEIIVNHGCATLQDMPYFVSDYTTWPSENVWKNAIAQRGEDYSSIHVLDDIEINQIKDHLASGDLAVIGIPVYDNFYYEYPNNYDGIDAGVLYADSGANWGGHAVTIIGYDDEKPYFDGTETKYGAFQLVNSWGPYWGVFDTDIGSKGTFWIAYEYIKKMEYPYIYMMQDKTSYEPKNLAKVHVQHDSRLDMNFSIQNNNTSETKVLLALPKNAGSPDQSINQNIYMDVTDVNSTLTGDLTLTAEDNLLYSGYTGTISLFSVENTILGGNASSVDVPDTFHLSKNANIDITFDFGTTYAISGTITDGTNPMANVTVTFSGSLSGSVTTDASGNYLFADLTDGGNYTVTPTKTDYTFEPVNKSYTSLASDVTGSNFVGAKIIVPKYCVSGFIKDALNIPIANAEVTVFCSGLAVSTCYTSVNGYYCFTDLVEKRNYEITIYHSGYIFEPKSKIINNLVDDFDDQNFKGIGPSISVDKQVLDFRVLDGRESLTLPFIITNEGGGVLNGRVESEVDWIKLNKTALLQNNETINVTVNRKDIGKDGQYRAKINITSNGGNISLLVKLQANSVLTKPNPFNMKKYNNVKFYGSGVVPYDTTIQIFTINGEHVKTLNEESGSNEIIWDGRNEDGYRIASGIYIYASKSPVEKWVGKFTVIKKN
ncbi:carboxypeptidase regulatory-like domain-containing protein [bacterium]